MKAKVARRLITYFIVKTKPLTSSCFHAEQLPLAFLTNCSPSLLTAKWTRKNYIWVASSRSRVMSWRLLSLSPFSRKLRRKLSYNGHHLLEWLLIYRLVQPEQGQRREKGERRWNEYLPRLLCYDHYSRYVMPHFLSVLFSSCTFIHIYRSHWIFCFGFFCPISDTRSLIRITNTYFYNWNRLHSSNPNWWVSWFHPSSTPTYC